ncbi:YkvA family protein [Chloroflexus sp.]|uniref:YkvA family protein n=1 Tax=Chloroflexus sp. TaxID=1904827 RepID=UPI002ACE0A49|nr:YkvA family protein [Chloroflexus sp.]
MLTALKTRARALKREAYALAIVMRDPRTPWYARAFLALVVAHTFSPIDLIPDFIPVLGYLDDLIITPLGIFLALKLIPPAVMVEARQQAESRMAHEKPVSWAGAVLVIGVWIIVMSVIGWTIFNL